DPAIERLRNRQVKNFLTVTVLSLGVPMLLMGDEVRRTQLGNNNAYCHDNETNWFDWSLVSKHADVHRFVRLLLARRTMRTLEHERRRWSLNEWLRNAKLDWHGVKSRQPDWSSDSHTLAWQAEVPEQGLRFYLALTAYCEPLDFERPAVSDPKEGWRRWIDTALDSPLDIVEWQNAQAVPGRTYRMEERSVVVLIGGAGFQAGGGL